MKTIGIYVHWPFCKKKCPYCDFNSHVRDKVDYDVWLKHYLQEIDYFSDFLKNYKISSIFFGGGTPSLMPPKIVEAILKKINDIVGINDIEVTIEANPTSSESGKFQDFKNAGINRLSIGIQSINDKDLLFLGREHSAKEAINTILMANKIFDNYSVDLMYARPKQTTQSWIEELEQILSYTKNHISLYQLTIEKGTKFYSQYKKGEFKMPNQDSAIEIYEKTGEVLYKHGLCRYEISNYAKNSKQCKHNLNYWRYNEYLGIGPGAHSRIKYRDNKMYSLMMIHSPEKWQESVNNVSHGIQKMNVLCINDIVAEFLLMGLRLEDGVDLEDFHFRFGRPLIELINIKNLDFYVENSFVIYDNRRIQLTNKGKMLFNYITADLLIL